MDHAPHFRPVAGFLRNRRPGDHGAAIPLQPLIDESELAPAMETFFTTTHSICESWQRSFFRR